MPIVGRWCLNEIEARELRMRQAARHVADERYSVCAEVEDGGCDQSADHEHERSRDRRRGEPQREDHGERDEPDEQRRPVDRSRAL